MSKSATDEPLIAPAFLFEFSVPCLHTSAKWSRSGVKLGEKYCLPSFAALDVAASEAATRWADVRMAWSDVGLLFNVRVQGKKQRPWCRAERLEDSDGLAVWIDTRNTPGIHRASRFCHQFRFLPAGGGVKLADPVAAQMKVERAREDASFADGDTLKIRSEKRVDGYLIQAAIPAAGLTGYDPKEHPSLGFTYAVFDREMGQQTSALGAEFPFQSDPSLWSQLELVRH